jgi:hypothetical protein
MVLAANLMFQAFPNKAFYKVSPQCYVIEEEALYEISEWRRWQAEAIQEVTPHHYLR